MRADSPVSLIDDLPLGRQSSFPEEFTNVNELLLQLEQRKSLNEGNSLKNAASLEYSVQEQIEEENSDPEEDESDLEREALENDMAPKKRSYSGSSSAEARSSSSQKSKITSGFAPQHGVDQGTGFEDDIGAHLMGPEETLSSVESNNRLAIPSISEIAVALPQESHRKMQVPGFSASPTSSIITNPG